MRSGNASIAGAGAGRGGKRVLGRKGQASSRASAAMSREGRIIQGVRSGSSPLLAAGPQAVSYFCGSFFCSLAHQAFQNATASA